jgi:hypothetical protein
MSILPTLKLDYYYFVVGLSCYTPLLDGYFETIFSHSASCHFNLLLLSFAVRKLLTTPFIYFFLVSELFGSYPKVFANTNALKCASCVFF